MGISLVVQMQIQSSATASNPQMKMFMYLMPVMIFAIFNKFASGLSLYYLCYNVLTAIQQKFINKNLEAKKAEEASSNGKGQRSDVKGAKAVKKRSASTKKKVKR